MNAAQAKRYTELSQCGYEFDHIDENRLVRLIQWDCNSEFRIKVREATILRDGSVVSVEPNERTEP